MRIVVKNIEYQGNSLIIGCESCVGRLSGVWNGRCQPKIGDSYDVELTIADVDSGHMRTQPHNGSAPSVDVRESMVIFSGICESYDGEMHFIRFAGDWLQMVYFKENRQNIHAGDRLLFWLDHHRVEIYPYDIC